MGIRQLLCRHETLYENTHGLSWRTETHYVCMDCGKVVLRIMGGIGSAYPPQINEYEYLEKGV